MIAFLLSIAMTSCPLSRTTVDGLPLSAFFGTSVRFTPDHLVVGAPRDVIGPGSLLQAGRVHVLDETPLGVWERVSYLVDPDPLLDASFGFFISCTNDRIAVGAPGSNHFGSASGTAIVFSETDDGWDSQRLVPSEPLVNQGFSAVAMDGDTIAVGAPGTSTTLGQGVGRVYIFEFNGEQWVETMIIDPPDEDAETFLNFGAPVSMRDGVMVVGAIGATVDGQGVAGRVYVYERDDAAQWNLTVSLVSDSPFAADALGRDAVTDGHRIVIGAQHNYSGDSGEAFVYVRDAKGAWELEHHLVPEFQELNAGYGRALAIQGDLVAVGMPFVDIGGENMGRVYLYDLNDVENPRTFEPPVFVERSSFGTALDFDRFSGKSRLAIGAWADDTEGLSRGAVYVIDLDACAVCPEDIDLSDDLGFSDLLWLLNSWGAQGSTDLDDNGTTDALDLLQLLTSWGPCL